MIEARKSVLFQRVFRLYNRRLLQKHFASVRAAGLDHVRYLDPHLPVVCIGNHSCWWDGLIELFFAREVFDCDPYLIMEEQQLVRYPFFRWLGAFR
ncbi:MAG: hypothetical protein C4326_07400 [Ignavibacteria bacterium]